MIDVLTAIANTIIYIDKHSVTEIQIKYLSVHYIKSVFSTMVIALSSTV